MNNLEEEISALKQELLKMFSLVGKQWKKTATAILEFDQDIAEEISSTETRVNALEIAIDRDCENILALLSPVAIDMRFVLSTYKINHELERIGDIAEGIANYICENESAYPKEVLEEVGLKSMLEQILSMISDISYAFEYEDTKVARKIFKKDKILNKYNADSVTIILNNMDIFDRQKLLFILSTVRKIERAGDSIKNIGEEIIFHLEAKVLKHAENKN
jgi:phosphate transport system protein|tara:strand:- start:42 stop:701 length:660 start_codon:yes stop_codon:yes gene_type:complete